MADARSDTRNWFLRISSGTIFGPVSTQGLATWAAQGRVLAGNEISTDRKQWQSAESLPELDISWYIEDGEGVLTGPCHRSVAEKIIATGTGQGDSSIIAAEDADLSRLRKTAASRPGADDNGAAAQPELDLESADATDAATADGDQAASWIEEREGLRLRIAELESQTQNILRAAEKETRTQNRQLENARKQIATMQAELEELRLLAGDPEAPAADSAACDEKAALEEALETARQEIADLRRTAERDSDTRQARITELEQQLAEASDSADTLEKLRAEQERLTAALAAEQSAKTELGTRLAQLENADAEAARLREALAAEQSAKAELDARLAQLENADAEAARLREALDEANEELERLRDEQAQLLSARKDIEALKVRIAELVGQIAEQDATAESVEMLQTRCTTLEASLHQAQESYAELLAFSNGRDQKHLEEQQAAEAQRGALQAQLEAAEASISELRQQLEEVAQQEPARIRELNARLRDQEMLVAGVLAEGRQITEQLLSSEREAFALLRDSSVARQTMLQARLGALKKQQGGETDDVLEREAKLRSDRVNSARTQEALDALLQEHARHVRQAESRERELINRIRVLELEEERLKARVADAEPLFQRNQRLTEQLRDREQELAQERQQRSIEQAQLEEAHQTLMAHIKTARQQEENLPLGAPEGNDPGAPPPHAFRPPPWMRLRK